ncbi:MAG: helix-turn-helix domain-containing protein [Gemmatimonadota bacterium]
MEIRTRILQAAARIYAETGFRGATTRRIATEAGVNEVTLFRHFGSKSALIGEAIGLAGQQTLPTELPAAPADPESELLAWAGHHIDGMREKRSLIRTCMGESAEHPEMMPPCGSPPALAATALATYLDRLRSAGIARAAFDSRTAAAFLMGALFADAMGRDLMPDMYRNDPHQGLAEYVRLFLRGIGVALT